MAALSRRDALLLLLNRAVSAFDLFAKITFDLAFGPLCGRGEIGQLYVIGIPARTREERFGFVNPALLDGLADVSDDTGHLILRTQLGGTYAL